ncbi:MAG TPA: hypothetical protein IAB27_03785 [Candidatus Coprosoma intestinipullorum]|uniref:Uncharacterized protein n=1 Tax=Candidatus Coprosoma intestinipullorum TaxID=2840752 RepID=A0A9D0ZQM3_9FIRM|nr:hypothetical protein [Candidatus Coprosoma intestinipullorum]
MLLNPKLKEEAEKILMTSYDSDDEITNAEDIIRDLIDLVHDKEQEKKDIIQDRDDNFQRVPISEQI